MLPEVKKENQISISEKKPKVNSYYMVLAGRFKVAKYVAICFLVAFLLTTVVLFRDEITVENLRYLFKDLEMGENVNFSTSGSTISYDSDAQLDLALYKGDLVIAGSSYFYLCDLQGNRRMNEESSFSNPVVVTSDKYLLVYGLSEYTCTLYNTFSKLHTEVFDYPITGAAVSDDGMYAIVTRTAEYKSAVYLYNSSFKRIGSIYKDKYIMDVEFNRDSSEVLIASVYSKDGNYCSEIMNYVPFSETPSSKTEVVGSMALKVGYNDDDGYSVIYDDKIEFYDSEFVLRNTYTFPLNMVPITTEISDKYTLLTYSENIVGNNMRVLVFDSSGELILNADADGQPKKLRCYNKYVFVLLDGKVCKINISNGNIDYYDTARNAIDLLVVNENSVLVCYSDRTIRVTTD